MDSNTLMIQEIGDKGKGVFTSCHIKNGDIIFEESPLVCIQFSWNKLYGYKACDHCMRPLETAEENVRRLSNLNDLILPFPELCLTNKSEHSICPNCYVEYCSEACKDIAWNKYHKTLCYSPDSLHPLSKLEEMWRESHYPPETTSIMIIVRIIALIEQADDKVPTINSFKEFSHFRFCKDDINDSHKFLGLDYDKLEIFRNVLINSLPNLSSVTQQLLTVEGFSSLCGVIGANGQGVGTSVFSWWIDKVSGMQLPPEQKQTIDDLISKIYDKMDLHVGLDFLNNEGSALYARQKFLNHSCDPNAKITFPFSNSTLKLVAIKDILPGDEICTSYLDECILQRSCHSRRNILRNNYHFFCTCNECLNQAAVQPDKTSEEEEESDGDNEMENEDD